MRGEFRAVWQSYVDDVLGRIALEWPLPIDWATDLCYATANATDPQSESHGVLMSVLESPDDAMEILWSHDPASFISETEACLLTKSFHEICLEHDDELAETFLELTTDFVQRFSLRYDVSRVCEFTVSTTGLVAGLVESVHRLGENSPVIAQRLEDVRESISDVEADSINERKIREAIRCQFLLAEALAKTCSSTSKKTLGEMCKELDDWPHRTFEKALSTLYGFRSDFPGLGHAGNQKAAIRSLDARDMAAMAAILFGFAPYLVDEFDGAVGLSAPSEVSL